MKKFLLLFLLMSFKLLSYTQDINETVEYINDKLQKYDHTSLFVKTMNSEYAPGWDISSHDKLSVFENGELVIEQITINEGVKSVGYEIRFFIKNLSDSVHIITELDSYKNVYFTITIKCANYGCMISKTTGESKSEKMSRYSFTLTDKTYAQRVVNAIKRLIEIANESENYLEDDPFK